MDINTVNYLANLGKLSFTPEEAERMAADMTGIIEIMDGIKEIDVSYDYQKDNHNVYLPDLRDDVRYDSFSREKIVTNAIADNGHFVVPKVVE